MRERITAFRTDLFDHARQNTEHLFDLIIEKSRSGANDFTLGILILATDISIELLHHTALINGVDAGVIFDLYQHKFNGILIESGLTDQNAPGIDKSSLR